MSSWQISWRGTTWTETDLTIGHMAVIVQIQGSDSWTFLNPFGGPVKLMGVLATLIAVDEHRAANDVLAELAHAPASELLNALSTIDDADVSLTKIDDDEIVITAPDPGPDGGVATVVRPPRKPKPAPQRQKV